MMFFDLDLNELEAFNFFPVIFNSVFYAHPFFDSNTQLQRS